MAQYHYEFSQAYVLQSIARYRDQLPKRLLRLTLKGVCFLGLTLLVVLGLLAKAVLVSGLFAFFVLLLLLGPRIDYWLLLRRFRKSPFYNNAVVTTLAENSYKCECETAKVELSWRTFTKGYRMRDGFLIFDIYKQFHWWPDSALKEGSVAEVEQLLQKSLPNYSA